MTNMDKWFARMDGVSSPTNFISWGYRFMISAALQRCVWCGYNDTKIYPNQYTIFVGEAAVGKGMVINPVMNLLRAWKKKDVQLKNTSGKDGESVIISQIEKANIEDAEEGMTKMKGNGEKIEPTLFPYAPDATTFEALVESMGKSFRRRNFPDVDEHGQPKLGIYSHCSMYFSLPELGSLMQKNCNSVMNYLLGVYDCPTDYEYVTKNKGKDRVRRGCINFLAGTTPSYMDTIFSQKLMEEGFSSRCFFICASKNRKNVFLIPPLTPEQLAYEKDIKDHIKNLYQLYGECRVDPSTWVYLQDWWDKDCKARQHKYIYSPKLKPYFGRKNLHVIKVAMAHHFGESLEMYIPQSKFEDAIQILAEEEPNMHRALTFEGENPLGKLTDTVLEYIRSYKDGAQKVDVVTAFWHDLPNGVKSAEEILEYLLSTGKIREEAESDPVTNKCRLRYKGV